jgi:hypothetical protein
MRPSVSLTCLALTACLLATASCNRSLQLDEVRSHAIEVYCSAPWSSVEAQQQTESRLREYQEAIQAVLEKHRAAGLDPEFRHYRRAMMAFQDGLTLVRQRVALDGVSTPAFAADDHALQLLRRYDRKSGVQPREWKGTRYLDETAPGALWIHAGSELEKVIDKRTLETCS